MYYNRIRERGLGNRRWNMVAWPAFLVLPSLLLTTSNINYCHTTTGRLRGTVRVLRSTIHRLVVTHSSIMCGIFVNKNETRL